MDISLTTGQIRGLILLSLFFINCLFTALIWLRGRSKETFHLGWLCFFTSLNTFAWAAIFLFPDKLFWNKASWNAGFVLSSYMIFIYYFTGRIKHIKLKIFINYAISGAILLLTFSSSLVINKISNQYPYIISETSGIYNSRLRLFLVLYFVLTSYYLISYYFKSTGFKKIQAKYLIWGILIYGTGSAFFSGILPLINDNKTFLDANCYFSIIFIGFTTYSIFKNELFQIKVIMSEVLVAMIGVLLFVQIFLVKGTIVRSISAFIFTLFCLVGYLLIKAMHKEAQKEQEAKKLALDLSDLNKSLEQKVDAKTQELQENIKELSDFKQALLNILEDMERARHKIEEEKNKTMAIIANFTDPIIVLDKNDKVIIINPAAERIFGLSKTDLNVLIADDNNYALENFKTIIKKDFTIKKIDTDRKENFAAIEEITLPTETQPIYYKVITAQVLGSNNEFLGTMKIFYDLTREKIIDKLKSDFITIAAHQLRTPLSAIKWAIKLVLDGDAGIINKEQQKLLYQGYRSNERVIVLINDMLNVSRIEEGRFGYTFAPGDFREVLNKVLEDAEFQLQSRKIELKQTLPIGIMEINMDKEKIALVLQNLVENAVNYTPESGKIEVAVEYGKNFLTFKIKDNGVGIPEKDKEKLFSKFFRADNVIRMQTEGSGLGLFISKNIIEQHRGEIHCRSTEGKGTEFDVVLPVK